MKVVRVSFWAPIYFVKNLELVAGGYENISWSRLMRMMVTAGCRALRVRDPEERSEGKGDFDYAGKEL